MEGQFYVQILACNDPTKRTRRTIFNPFPTLWRLLFPFLMLQILNGCTDVQHVFPISGGGGGGGEEGGGGEVPGLSQQVVLSFFIYFLFLPTPTTHTHDPHPHPRPTTHDPRQLATLLIPPYKQNRSKPHGICKCGFNFVTLLRVCQLLLY